METLKFILMPETKIMAKFAFKQRVFLYESATTKEHEKIHFFLLMLDCRRGAMSILYRSLYQVIRWTVKGMHTKFIKLLKT
jgi:hypothetical protein